MIGSGTLEPFNEHRGEVRRIRYPSCSPSRGLRSTRGSMGSRHSSHGPQLRHSLTINLKAFNFIKLIVGDLSAGSPSPYRLYSISTANSTSPIVGDQRYVPALQGSASPLRRSVPWQRGTRVNGLTHHRRNETKEEEEVRRTRFRS